MSQRYIRPDWFTSHVLNPSVSFLMRLGISVLGSRVLAVRGRTTGEWRTTPVNVLTYQDNQYLVSPRGITQWVRNVRAGGEAELRLGQRREPIHLDELSDGEKPAILRAYLRRWAFEVAEFFDGVEPNAPESALAVIAPDLPVFRILP
jgi:deazaflavin-dependent oxidoreductase (nitroreductase family)